jgi:hypothetical protein
MILRFERELQRFDPDVTIPYWDSTVDRTPFAPLWANSFLGQFNSAWSLNRALGSATLPTSQQVQTNQGRGTYDAFWPELENVIHNPPHNWVGGAMARPESPLDPAFYLHHCWIDLLWARWQRAHPGAQFVSSMAGGGLNDPLMEWPDRTPAHVLNHHALGYLYDIELPPLRVLVHLQDFGDRTFRENAFAGTRGESRRLEGFQLQFDPPVPGLSMRYMAHLQDFGDVSFENEGQFIGTRGQSRRLEGFAIELTGTAASNFNVLYMAHLQDFGDTRLFKNGEFCGTRGQSRRVEGILVRVEPR